MIRQRARLLGLIALAALLAPCVWHLLHLGAIVRARLAFPDDINWIEGGNVYHAWRLAHGLPIYSPPSSGFAAYPYPPLYWVAVAVAGRIFGLGYAAARGVSIGCATAAALLLAVAASRRAPAHWLGLALGALALAAVAAGYPACEGAYDLARNDSMATLLVVLAVALAGDGVLSPVRALGVAALLAGAMYTKQTSLAFAVWIAAFALVRARRGGALLAAGTTAGVATAFALLQASTQGWFGTWILDQRHQRMHFWTWAAPLPEVLPRAPYLLVLPLLVAWLARRGRLTPATAKWVGTLAVSIATACVVRVKDGSTLNLNLAVLVLAGPVTAMVLRDWLSARWEEGRRAVLAAWGVVSTGSLLLVALAYPAARFVPSPDRWRNAALLRQVVRGLDGCVVVTTEPLAAVDAGKAACTQPIFQAYLDASNSGIDASFAEALLRDGAKWVVVTSSEHERGLPEQLEPWFEQTRTLDLSLGPPDGSGALRPATLWRRRE